MNLRYSILTYLTELLTSKKFLLKWINMDTEKFVFKEKEAMENFI